LKETSLSRLLSQNRTSARTLSAQHKPRSEQTCLPDRDPARSQNRQAAILGFFDHSVNAAAIRSASGDVKKLAGLPGRFFFDPRRRAEIIYAGPSQHREILRFTATLLASMGSLCRSVVPAN